MFAWVCVYACLTVCFFTFSYCVLYTVCSTFRWIKFNIVRHCVNTTIEHYGNVLRTGNFLPKCTRLHQIASSKFSQGWHPGPSSLGSGWHGIPRSLPARRFAPRLGYSMVPLTVPYNTPPERNGWIKPWWICSDIFRYEQVPLCSTLLLVIALVSLHSSTCCRWLNTMYTLFEFGNQVQCQGHRHL